MITTTANSSWKFISDSNSTSTLVVPTNASSVEGESKTNTLTRPTQEEDFISLSFSSRLQVSFRSLRFTASAKFLELKTSTSSLAIPKTIRGIAQSEDGCWSYRIIFPTSGILCHDVHLKFLRLNDKLRFSISDVQADLTTTSEPMAETMGRQQANSTPSIHPTQLAMMMSMQKKFVGMFDSLESCINQRFEELNKRVAALEQQVSKNSDANVE